MNTDLAAIAREVALAWLTNDDATVADLEAAIVRVASEHAERETESALTALSSARARAERWCGLSGKVLRRTGQNAAHRTG